MVDYRSKMIPGACYFFTVTLLGRTSRLLVERIADLREAWYPCALKKRLEYMKSIREIFTLTPFSSRLRLLIPAYRAYDFQGEVSQHIKRKMIMFTIRLNIKGVGSLMIMKKTLIMIFMLLAFNSAVYAGGVVDGYIGMVQPQGDGSIYIYFDSGMFTPPSSCSWPQSNNPIYRVDGANSNAILLAAMTAMVAQLKVEIIGSNLCINGYETVSAIRVKRQSGFTNYQ